MDSQKLSSSRRQNLSVHACMLALCGCLPAICSLVFVFFLKRRVHSSFSTDTLGLQTALPCV